MPSMETPSRRTLGRTDIRVTPVGLGTMEFSGGGRGMLGSAYPPIGPAEKNAIVKAALDGGINWFDTAELYGGGHAEASLAAALKAAGKKRPGRCGGDQVVAFSPDRTGYLTLRF